MLGDEARSLPLLDQTAIVLQSLAEALPAGTGYSIIPPALVLAVGDLDLFDVVPVEELLQRSVHGTRLENDPPPGPILDFFPDGIPVKGAVQQDQEDLRVSWGQVTSDGGLRCTRLTTRIMYTRIMYICIRVYAQMPAARRPAYGGKWAVLGRGRPSRSPGPSR